MSRSYSVLPDHHNQVTFNLKYITAQEIMHRCNVKASQVKWARDKGVLPNAILVNSLGYIWDRLELEPHLVKWEDSLETARFKRTFGG